MVKRFFDFFITFVFLIILTPFLLIISFAIVLSSKGNVFYLQKRVGFKGKDFTIYKFRTMYTGSDSKGLITVGSDDKRITTIGIFLRKYKLDELPQLFNVLIGEMSLVGPRPEVRKYVELYNKDQLKVFEVLPGITDYASLEFSNESDILAMSAHPENEYVERIMPAKLKLNLKYIDEMSFVTDLKIIYKTIRKIMF